VPVQRIVLLVSAALALVAGPAAAQSVESFYRGKTVTVDVFTGPGGGTDIVARLIAQNMGRHIPGNPAMVVKGVLGGGGIVLTNHLYNNAPKDGTELGTINRPNAFDPLFGLPNTHFDPLKFNWIGSEGKETLLGISWQASPVKTLLDATKQELTVGADAPGADLSRMPLALNAAVGTKFKVIIGYPSGNEILLAMERGEVGGRIGIGYDSLMSTRPDWVKTHQVNLLVQMGVTRDSRIPDVPLAIEHAKTPLDKAVLELVFSPLEMSRPYLLPPGVPPERAAAIRAAFMATMTDPEFVAASGKAQMSIEPISGDEILGIIKRAYAQPREVIERAKAIYAAN